MRGKNMKKTRKALIRERDELVVLLRKAKYGKSYRPAYAKKPSVEQKEPTVVESVDLAIPEKKEGGVRKLVNRVKSWLLKITETCVTSYRDLMYRLVW